MSDNSDVTETKPEEKETTIPSKDDDTLDESENDNSPDSIETDEDEVQKDSGNKKLDEPKNDKPEDESQDNGEKTSNENSTNEKSPNDIDSTTENSDIVDENKIIDSSNNESANSKTLFESPSDTSLSDSNATLSSTQHQDTTSTWIYLLLIITVSIILLLSYRLMRRKSKPASRKQWRGLLNAADRDAPSKYNEIDYQDVEMQDWSESDREGDVEDNEYLAADIEGSNDHYNANFNVVFYQDNDDDNDVGFSEESENIDYLANVEDDIDETDNWGWPDVDDSTTNLLT
ncbi:4340_t:CDS:2 [Ambispora leptoticha]|uniref:4340_t:CDS:1 n=1 Tax=Ambispora leptoticha TaxID=144679 RepID=A0A9N8WES7_9GLOM|nr:4340_t:CDS:2 [Ambispora leptoticha]